MALIQPTQTLISTSHSSSLSIPASAPTPFPNYHTYGKRHVYLCGDQTLSWRTEWYTAEFFTLMGARASYDSAASRGPVQPPTRIFQDAPECAAILSLSLSQSRPAESASSAVSLSTSRNGRTSDSEEPVETDSEGQSQTDTDRTDGVVVTTRMASTFTSDGSSFTTTIRTVATVTPTLTTPPNTMTSQTQTALSIASQSTLSVSTTASSSIMPTASAKSSLYPSSSNACAGKWDWQAWGVVSSLGAGLIIGGLLWALWFLMKRRHPAFYSPRTWFVPTEPSKPWTLLTFLLPFLHLPSASSDQQPSAGTSSLHVLFAALKMAAFVSLLALAAVLPIILAGVPCLGETAPRNTFGGRLGTLTDLSLLRLLNALDSSPDSAATTNTLRIMFSTPKRSLSSTIAPAINSARVRLIVILVLLGVLGVGGGLFIIARTYAWLARANKHFEENVCQGVDMVFISARDAGGWKGMSEEGLRRALKEWTGRIPYENENKKETEVLGVFAIPIDTSELASRIRDRERVLLQLEVAEMNYISSFKLTHTQSAGDLVQPLWWTEADQPSDGLKQSSPNRNTPPTDFIAPKQFYKVGSVAKPHSKEKLNIPVPAPLRSETDVAETRFHEISRDSALYGGRFAIGQRIRMDEHGNYVSDSSSGSEETHGSLSMTPGTAEESGEYYTAEDVQGQEDVPAQRTGSNEIRRSGESGTSGPRPLEMVPSAQRSSTKQPTSPPMSPRSRRSVSRKPPLETIASVHRHSGPPSALAHQYHAIVDSRAKFKELNGEIEKLQRLAFAGLTKSNGDVEGWVVVGRGVRWFPSAQRIEGVTREDIIWANAGKIVRERMFWVKVAGLMVLLIGLMIPFIGLTVATAPGVSHYLTGLQPLADSDGFGSGFVQALVPTIVLSSAVGLAIRAVDRFSKRAKCISRERQKILAYRATFYILLLVCLVCMLLMTALEYAVDGFKRDLQAARTVGDGAIFSTWFVFVLLLNLAFISPAIYLLRPRSLLKHLKTRRNAVTPRQKFRVLRPPCYNPAFALAPCVLGVFYASTLLFIFPLLLIPILLLLYLSFVANRYMAEYVFIDSSARGNFDLGLWTIRRFGWTLAFQPTLYGLIMLSRNEWALGGISLGIALIALIMSECLTVWRYRSKMNDRFQLSGAARKALDELKIIMGHPIPPSNSTSTANATSAGRQSMPDSQSHSHSHSGGSRNSLHSDLSLRNRVTALLPGYTRLPETCPVPLPTEQIDDLHSAERASYANPLLASATRTPEHYFSEDLDSIKGLIYPPEMIATVPVIWLHRDRNGLAFEEVGDLDRFHGLRAIVDPPLPGEEEDEQLRSQGRRPKSLGRSTIGRRDSLGRPSAGGGGQPRGSASLSGRRLSIRSLGKGKGKEKEKEKESAEEEVGRPLLNS